MRRLIDILFAVLCLTLLLPGFVLIAVLTKLESPAPAFYRQPMLGWKGRRFTLYRFRTMFLSPEHGASPRFTRVGQWIRNFSLDHLPQLLNLLNGDLTLIGPRPMEVDSVDPEDPR